MPLNEVQIVACASRLTPVVLTFAIFALVLSIATYFVSTFGRKRITQEMKQKNEHNKFINERRIYNTAVYYLDGSSSSLTLIAMIIFMWQTWSQCKFERTVNQATTTFDSESVL